MRRVSILTNEAKVLALLSKGNMTRSEMAEVSGLSYSAIVTAVNNLLILGLITPVGERKKIGRTRTEVVFGITPEGRKALMEMVEEEEKFIEELFRFALKVS